MCGQDISDLDTNTLSGKYTYLINKLKYFILLFWLIILITSCIFAPRLMSSTTNEFPPPKGSEADFANNKLREWFPRLSMESEFIVLAYSKDGKAVLGDAFKGFSFAVNQSVYALDAMLVRSVSGYYLGEADGFPMSFCRSFMDEENTTSLITMSIAVNNSHNRAVEYAIKLEKVVDELASKHLKDSNVEVYLIGLPAFIPVIQTSIELDLGMMDGIVLPLALLVLALILRSLRLMILPLIAIATSAATSFAAVYFFSLAIDIVSFTPSLMMSILIAMSIDYSLFLLTRYREEVASGVSGELAVQTMLSTAGHTILVSGITLCGCFAGLILMPINLLVSTGVGCSISILIILSVNMTQTPALLLIFPRFFRNTVKPVNCCGILCTLGSVPELDPENQTLLTNQEEQALLKMKKSMWYKLGKITLKFPWNILLILVFSGIVVPFALHSYNYIQTDDLILFFPRNSTLSESYQILSDKFGPGKVEPFKILVVPPENVTILSEEFFDTLDTIITEMATLNKTNITNFQSISMAGGTKIPFFFVAECVFEKPDEPFCKALNFVFDTFVNENQTSTYILVNLDWEPDSPYGDVWIKEARKKLESLTDHTDYQLYLTGTASNTWAAINGCFDSFPTVISVTSAVVFLFVAISFRSVIVPLRSVVTIGMTVLFVYGLATFTYQMGIFDWTPIPGMHSIHAVIWIVPLINFSIIVGISLDYDVFLLVRIKEFRDKGFSTRDSILQGLYKTGGIITAAGVIMAVAFSGLIASNMNAINELGFYLVFSVLFDTFIVRSLLVPALMGILGEINWFPGYISKAEYKTMEEGFQKSIQ
eukprot:TRINITY_DN2016_c0_g1_i1.p1 TRINITY_DN2016_c0_g1~~TRINITY_DN2016_c0_g1_i1.p1  ORF type:complete len:825 (+),score=136.61 TRINITY_DN2016_c0_g1_i1:23-2497(+)